MPQTDASDDVAPPKPGRAVELVTSQGPSAMKLSHYLSHYEHLKGCGRW